MAESLPEFIAARQATWQRLERSLEATRAGKLGYPDVLDFETVLKETADDFSRARQAFPTADVTRYLAGLLGRAHVLEREASGPRWRSPLQFLAHTFPLAAWAERWWVIAAFAAIGLGFLLGVLSVASTPDAANVLVPEHLREFVNAGRLWTDELEARLPPGQTASEIFINNLRVAYAAFSFGLLFGLGSLAVLMINGIFLGATMTVCARAGLLPSLLLFTAAHGPLEISCIALCGAAGLRLGASLVAPGPWTRGAALRATAAHVIPLVMGASPVLVVAGLIEGYVSPSALFPAWAKVALGVTSGLGFWLWVRAVGVSTPERTTAFLRPGGPRPAWPARPSPADERSLQTPS